MRKVVLTILFAASIFISSIILLLVISQPPGRLIVSGGAGEGWIFWPIGVVQVPVELPNIVFARSPHDEKITYGCEVESTIWAVCESGMNGSDLQVLWKAPAEVNWVVVHNWSPDGKFIALTTIDKDGSRKFSALNSETGELNLLLSDGGAAYPATWSPDGKQLAYVESYEGDAHKMVKVMNMDDHAVSEVAEGSFVVWTPDGENLVSSNSPEIFSIKPDGSNRIVLFDSRIDLFDNRDFLCLNPVNADFSPSGKFLAYACGPQGSHVFLLDIDQRRIRTLTPTRGGYTWVHWLP